MLFSFQYNTAVIQAVCCQKWNWFTWYETKTDGLFI